MGSLIVSLLNPGILAAAFDATGDGDDDLDVGATVGQL